MIGPKTIDHQRFFVFVSIILIITFHFGVNSLPFSVFRRTVLLFVPLIPLTIFILCFDLWQSTWGKTWVLSATLFAIASQLYLNLPINPLFIFHILFLVGVIILYQKFENRERRIHQTHLRTIQALIRQHPPLIQTIDYTCEAIIILDRDGVIVEANSQVTRLLNMAETSLVGKHIFDVLGILSNFNTSNPPENGELTYKIHPEGEKHLRFQTRPLIKNNHPSGSMLMLFDISEEKKRADAYLQAAKLSIVNQVSAGLAHEIRNPLTTIKGFMQLISPEQWPESFRPYQSLILDEVQTIEQMLNKFVLVTSPSAPQMRPVNLTETILALTQMIQPIHQAKGITIIPELSTQAIYVMGDHEQLSQALLSLLNNAIQASPKRESIIINLTECDSQIRISVIDKGPGIPESLRKRVFEPFFTTQKEGTGLGLTVAQQIIHAHHGNIYISESRTMNGTEAIIELPCLSFITNNLSA